MVDCNFKYVVMVDELVCIGLVLLLQSYFNILVLIVVVEVIDVQVIYLGYGFLLENVDFVECVEELGFIFIGFKVDIICMMGDKVEVICVMKVVGVLCVFGLGGLLGEDIVVNIKIVCEIGYLVIIKVVGGGGGCGMCVVYVEVLLKILIEIIKSEVKVVFGNGEVYMEKFLENLCYVEIQVLVDGQGNVIYFGECDCLMQCCYQKVVEEVLVLGIIVEQCEQIGKVCIEVCICIGYRGVGMFEFLYEDGCFYFIEMNICIQVEYLVIEMVIGIDLVVEQLKIVVGQKLLIKQSDVVLIGYVIECCINVEDVEIFVLSLGIIIGFYLLGGFGVCVDIYIYSGYCVLFNYDLMIGKLIVYGLDCEIVIVCMWVVLSEMVVDGIKINIVLQQWIMCDKGFQVGGQNIYYLEKCFVECKNKLIVLI